MIGESVAVSGDDQFARRFAELERRLGDLERAGIRVPWIAVTSFLNGWVNYNAAGGTWQNAAYRKVGDRVELRGLVANTGSVGTTIFSLPVGYRPPAALLWPTIAGNLLGRINVMPNGDVNSEPSLGAASFFSLNVSFSVL